MIRKKESYSSHLNIQCKGVRVILDEKWFGAYPSLENYMGYKG